MSFRDIPKDQIENLKRVKANNYGNVSWLDLSRLKSLNWITGGLDAFEVTGSGEEVLRAADAREARVTDEKRAFIIRMSSTQGYSDKWYWSAASSSSCPSGAKKFDTYEAAQDVATNAHDWEYRCSVVEVTLRWSLVPRFEILERGECILQFPMHHVGRVK